MSDAPAPPWEYTRPGEVEAAESALDAGARFGTLATPRYHLRHLDWGDAVAPAVLFVHGLSDQMRSFAMVMARLVPLGFRCVGLELADGAGDGARLGGYKHSDHAADIVCLLDHLGISRAHLFAASYGSAVGLRLALDSPERVGKIVLQGGFARRPLNVYEVGLARLARFVPGRMGDLPGRAKAMKSLDGPQFAGADGSAYAFMLRMSGASPIRAVAQRAAVLATLDLRPRLGEVAPSVLLIGGAADPVVPRECERELERGLRDVRRAEFPGGHYPQYTLPGPTAAACAGFLGGRGG